MGLKVNFLFLSIFFLCLFLILTFFYWGYVVTEEEIFSKLITKIKSLEIKISQEFVPLQVIVKEIENDTVIDIFLIKFIILSVT